MRTKEQILNDIRQNINKAPKETRPMLEHEYCYIEVHIDIRDQLNSLYAILCSVENISFRPR